jgi:hypothetical protein|tara:strand:- start:587 stop:766 length:180 start_codon:yes stop_codon:yes gene_type:complete
MTPSRRTVNPNPRKMVGNTHEEPPPEQQAIAEAIKPRPDREQERNRAKLDTGVVFIVLV